MSLGVPKAMHARNSREACAGFVRPHGPAAEIEKEKPACSMISLDGKVAGRMCSDLGLLDVPS